MSAQQLERDGASQAQVERAVYDAHSTLAESRDDLVVAKGGSDQRIYGNRDGRGPRAANIRDFRISLLRRYGLAGLGNHRRQAVEERFGSTLTTEQRLDLLPQTAVDRLRGEESIALVRRQLEHSLPECFELPPVVGRRVAHACHRRSLSISRCNQT